MTLSLIKTTIRYYIAMLIIACTPKQTIDNTDYIQQQSIVDISYLKTLYQGSCEMITENIVIEGQIIANNMMGEFGDLISIEDNTGGVAVACEVNPIEYCYGRVVKLLCCGLWISRYDGKIEIGATPTSSNNVEAIASESLSTYFALTEDISEPTAQSITIDELSAIHISTLVKLEDLSFVIEEGCEQYCDKLESTGRNTTSYRTVVDSSGQSIRLLFLYSCDYADLTIPTTPVTIYAIVDYVSGEYLLRVVNFQIFY